MTKRLVFAALALYIISQAALAQVVQIFYPPQRLRTFDERLKLSGKAVPVEGLTALYVNGKKISPRSDGLFYAGLILHPGKNLVEIDASFSGGSSVSKQCRIMRTVKFADSDELYFGSKHWSRSVLLQMATLGIIEAYPDGNFFPNNDVTRGELATWLSKTKALKIEPAGTDLYYDVPRQHWRAPYIQAVVRAGFMRSKGANYFGIDDTIKRSEAVEIALLAQGVPEVPVITDFMDEDSVKQVISYQLWLASSYGLILGTSEQMQVFDADRNMKRAEAVLLLSRLEPLRTKVASINDWNAGFGRQAFCEVKPLPRITGIRATPESVVADGRSSVTVSADIWEQDGGEGISVVKTDLSDLGGAPDTAMSSRDLTYSTSFPIMPETSPGQRTVTVTAVDRNGWQDTASASLTVLPQNFPPEVLSAIAFPPSTGPGGRTMLAVKVFDRNGLQDIDFVGADLGAFGEAGYQMLSDSGSGGDHKKGDGIFMKEIKVPESMKPGTYEIPVTVSDSGSSPVTAKIMLEIK